MRIAIVHNAAGDADAPDERDVLVQAQAVGSALSALGHEWTCLPCTLDLAELKRWLRSQRTDLVFNLVESLDGRGRLIHLVPCLLDALGLAYTGSGAEAILATSHKVLAKDRLTAVGLPTPAWIGPFPADLPAAAGVPAGEGPARWLVKSLWEHASIGIDESSATLCDSSAEAEKALRRRAGELGGACFAEQYIAGREFNLSLLAGSGGPEVMRPAEILFEDYPQEALRIVGYRAKWDADSYEFQHTPRCFDFSPQDAGLLERLKDLALQSWRAFGLNGYARVDFRVDAAGQPWILEINANPCLSPDAGFAAALQATGVSFAAAIARILDDARRPVPDKTALETLHPVG